MDVLCGSICLEHSEKPPDPFALLLSDAFAQAIEDDAIVNFSLTISLGIL